MKQQFTQATYPVNNVRLLSPQVKGDAPNVQATFDKGTEDGRNFINQNLLAELANTLGAFRIGFSNIDFSSDNVGDALIEILAQLQDIVLDQIPDGTVTDVKLSNADGQTKSRLTALENVVGNDFKVGTSTIPTTGWVASTGDNPYKLNLAITGVTATSWVDVSIDRNSQDVALDAGINPTIEEYEGGITIFATTIPSAEIPIRYAISKEMGV